MRRLALLGAIALLAGCGGERKDTTAAISAPAPSRTVAAVPPGTTGPTAPASLDPQLIAALGDSITAGSPLWDPDPSFRVQIAASRGRTPDVRSQWEFWFKKSHPGFTLRNCGVFGERVEQIEAREAACVAGAKLVVVQGGINDIAQGQGIAGAAQHLTSIVATLKAEGHSVVLVQVLPWNNGYPQAAPLITALNAQIDALGRASGVPVLPWYRLLEDPAAPGRMRRELTIDGDHPSIAGYRMLAATVPVP